MVQGKFSENCLFKVTLCIHKEVTPRGLALASESLDLLILMFSFRLTLTGGVNQLGLEAYRTSLSGRTTLAKEVMYNWLEL